VNKRPQRRFETEEEIIRAIDKAKAQADYQQQLSADLYQSSKRAWKSGDRASAQELEDKAKAADVKASQLIQLTLKRLGERLSEFRTQRMPFLGDESIPR
jgi:hypothetical protein